MKKLQYRKFGGLEVLELAEVPVPEPAAGEVLVRVRAAAINPIDWKLRTGQLKLLSGWRFPQGQGYEFAGVVERVGRGVTSFAVGQEVFGAGKDCIAEYAIAKVGRIARKPATVSFEVASTIAAVGTTAASAFGGNRVPAGASVLINGATGGIGMFATQMAARRKAEVTAVVSDKGIDLARRWGASRVINYRHQNVLELGREYDVIIELSDRLSYRAAKAILKPGGTFIASLPNPAEFVPGFLGNLVSSHRYALMGMQATSAVLSAVADEVASGCIDILVSQTFAIDEFREAYEQTAAGRFAGKVVFHFSDSHMPSSEATP